MIDFLLIECCGKYDIRWLNVRGVCAAKLFSLNLELLTHCTASNDEN